MVLTLTYLYATADDEKKNIITEFIETNSFINEWNIDAILEYDTNSKIIDSDKWSYSNGVEAMDSIISSFKSICQ